VFKNRVLIKIVWHKTGEVTADWKRLCNGELHNLYPSSIIWVVKSKRLHERSMWHVRGRIQVCTGFWCGNLGERDHLGDLGVNRRIIVGNRMEKRGLDRSGSG
jgi:hypothetical protein